MEKLFGIYILELEGHGNMLWWIRKLWSKLWVMIIVVWVV